MKANQKKTKAEISASVKDQKSPSLNYWRNIKRRVKRRMLIGQIMQRNQGHPQGANMRIGIWQSDNFNATYSYPYFWPPMPMPWIPPCAHIDTYSSWVRYDTRAHSPSYFRPSHQYYAAREDEHLNNHMLKIVSIIRNRSRAQERRKRW